MPTEIFGQPLSKRFGKWHASDIVRNRILRQFGGTYLDRDVYVVKSLDPFRNYELTLDYEIRNKSLETEYKVLGTQTLIGHRKARFLDLWLLSYCDYRPDEWYYNAGELPTTEILAKRPDLVNGLNGEFAAEGRRACPLLYHRYYRGWRQKYYTTHLNIRGDHFLQYDWCFDETFLPAITRFDEYIVRQLNTTFGEMARDVLDYEISVN
ncbi:uncharacterized protein LOC128956473 [Oppia nitens]|uniref:uncharacterized protein LOC128956473 n=1 Tax=Oppia nitens TaxID=1686743 RepID=UPI0023DC6E84|nr:uncharacterized protein LOC128956473 [Oppia nitens]